MFGVGNFDDDGGIFAKFGNLIGWNRSGHSHARRPISPPPLPEINLNSDRPPNAFLCNITKRVATDPVYAKCKHIFDRYPFEEYLLLNPRPVRCPVQGCRTILKVEEVVAHTRLAQSIRAWRLANPAKRDPDTAPPLPEVVLGNPKPSEDIKCAFLIDIMTDPAFLPCKHAFQFAEIRKWLNNALASLDDPKCPTCRAPTQPSQVKRWPALKLLIEQWRASLPPGSLVEPPLILPSRPLRTSIQNPRIVEPRILRAIIELAARIDLKKPTVVPDLKGLIARFPNAENTLNSTFNTIYFFVYKAYRKQLQKNPRVPDFGRKAFHRIDGQDVSPKIRQDAISAVALKQLIRVFQDSDLSRTYHPMRCFDQLPRRTRDGIYHVAKQFLLAAEEEIEVDRMGEYAFRGSHGYSFTFPQKAMVIESYLQTKV